LILFYIPFDVGCPQGSPVQGAVLEDLLKQFNCKQILFDRRSLAGWHCKPKADCLPVFPAGFLQKATVSTSQ
jgi:hypothetical protein